MVEIKILRLDKGLPMPKYAKDGDAAFDLMSAEDCTLKPQKFRTVKTGMAVEVPRGYFGNIRDRSGLAAKHGIHTMAGILDSGYRGEIGIVLVNLSSQDFTVTRGMRIAQMLIQTVEHAQLIDAESLSDTERGSGGFGSSGTH